jgi:hypothetical protein
VGATSAESPKIHAEPDPAADTEAIVYGKILPNCRIGEALSGGPSPHPDHLAGC